MKKEYSKPEISASAYAEFENVLTWGCSKQYAKPEANCEGKDEWDPPPYTGQSDFPCAHGEGPHNIKS